ncbi:bisanhydrobacterioruberin hydratase [Halobacterium hubeiense]|uniref:Bisanhydrobacterioruberin hydratase n=1 Tax=Halobacterium hubeiense TaxID=1407499 RepID=A0A0U5HW97_9EURY|nr:bisanhydrobacterioruberin hydratase [Halobacterium hubeiense]CQH60309.1 bisanhydrobacterioruberin hydratase [Halobacterium hubeiense]
MSEATTRARVERRLDDLVAGHRFEIAVVFPVVGAVLLLASAWGWLPEPLAFNPYLVLAGVAVMRLPLIAGLLPVTDRKAAVAVLALVAYAFGIEFVGVATGWPYGHFEYLVELGPMLAGSVPLGLPVFFLPLVVNSYLLVLLLFGRHTRRAVVRLPAVAAVVVWMDVVLDPGAVALGFWAYDAAGAYYGVPLSNYLGWVLSATVSVAVLDWGFDRAALRDRLAQCPFFLDDLVSFVLLWGAVNLVFGQLVPALAAGLLGVALVETDRFDFSVLRRNPAR